ncbi:MAG TPA: hypothetical protein VF623_10325 [Segetibacter sp.]|jgi:hypothetical protein
MTDTPRHIYDLQLQLWLAKTPAERLHTFMTDNEALLKFFAGAKATGVKAKIISVDKKLAASQLH